METPRCSTCYKEAKKLTEYGYYTIAGISYALGATSIQMRLGKSLKHVSNSNESKRTPKAPKKF